MDVETGNTEDEGAKQTRPASVFGGFGDNEIDFTSTATAAEIDAETEPEPPA